MFAAAAKLLATVQETLLPSRVDPNRLPAIRQAMLDLLSKAGCDHYPQVEQRIVNAPNVSALWFLRPELLMVLAEQAGEARARAMVDEITAMFQGLLPHTMHPKARSFER